MSDQPWSEARLGDIADLAFGATPSRNVDHFWDTDGTGYPWASIADLRISPISKTSEQITKAGVKGSRVRLVKSGTPLMSFKLTIGRVAIAEVDLYTNEAIVAVRGKAGFANDRWLFHALPRIASAGIQDSAVKGNTLNKHKLENLLLCLPPLDEQCRIADVLDAADDAIRTTERLVTKLEQAKQGLLQDLLTCGIDSSGRLRDRNLDAAQFGESPLGVLPKDWRICEIGAICSLVVDCPHTTPIFQDHGTLVARTTNIRDGQFVLQGASYVNEKEYRARIIRAEPQPGDLIFTREAPVGEAFVVPAGMRICLGQRVMLLRPDPQILDPTYMLAQIYSGFVGARINLLTAGTTNPHLNVGEVRNFLIPIPGLNEQRLIAGIVSQLDSELHLLSNEINKSRLLKQGLMDDLLAGRMRVSVSA